MKTKLKMLGAILAVIFISFALRDYILKIECTHKTLDLLKETRECQFRCVQLGRTYCPQGPDRECFPEPKCIDACRLEFVQKIWIGFDYDRHCVWYED